MCEQRKLIFIAKATNSPACFTCRSQIRETLSWNRSGTWFPWIEGCETLHHDVRETLRGRLCCLCFDYRGWGDSEGNERGWVMPKWQAEDIRNAITFMQTRPEIDPDRIATYGSGGTGGGNAVYVAAIDSRVKCCVSYLGVSSGRDWLHSMRREYEWVDYLKSIDDDRKKRVTTGSGAIVSAREGGIMVQTPERQTTTIKKDVAEIPMPCRWPARSDSGIQPHRCRP